jgi:hypothetical protein
MLVRDVAGRVLADEWQRVTGRDIIPFKLSLDKGEATFLARVISNTGVIVYTAADTERVARDGQEVRMTAVPIKPVLAVYPDSIDLVPGTSLDTLTIVNRGIDTLRWRVLGVSPGTAMTCPPSRARCIALSDTAGTTIAGQAPSELRLAADVLLPRQTYRLTIGSDFGSVAVTIRVAQQ